jgi:hypothetical protein
MCYSRYFGGPGLFYPWSHWAVDALFVLAVALTGVYLVRFASPSVQFAFTSLMAAIAIGVTAIVYSLARGSVEGCYF